MFAASWQKIEKAWHFDGDGEKSGIYKSEDGGTSWQLVTTKKLDFLLTKVLKNWFSDVQ